jgi:hypothetical protein
MRRSSPTHQRTASKWRTVICTMMSEKRIGKVQSIIALGTDPTYPAWMSWRAT